VRPELPPEECPSGALKAMAGLNLKMGDKGDALFPPAGTGGTVISVREGWTSMYIVGRSLGVDLPSHAILKGRLIFGAERVYGRFTQAQEEDGPRTWPVCLELLGEDGNRGMVIKSGSTADTARVLNTNEVKVVERFQGG
jgi:serine/threonine-protein kinase